MKPQFRTFTDRPVKTAKPEVSRQSVYDAAIYPAQENVDRSAIDALIDRAIELDRRFGLDFESAVNDLLNRYTEAGFIAGFRVGQNPESIILAQGEGRS